MGMFTFILFMSALALWFFTCECDTLLGVYEPTCAMRGRDFKWLVFIMLVLGFWISRKGDVSASVGEHLGIFYVNNRTILVILMSSFIALLGLKFFDIKSSAAYALLGSFGACWAVHGLAIGVDKSFILSFIVAPLMAFVLSAIVRFLLRSIFSRIHVHMITLSLYMRHAVIACVIFAAVALGLNWGGLIHGMGNLWEEESAACCVSLAVVGGVMLIFMISGHVTNVKTSSKFADFSIYAVVSVGFSVAVTLLFFSFYSTTAVLGLEPAPLSVAALVAASVAGSEIAQHSRLVSNEEYVKEALSMTAAPVLAFLLSYVLFSVTGDGLEDAMSGFLVMSFAVLILLFLAFVEYAKEQRAQKEASDRIMYAQRQQIYEHSRALSDMELKVVISENQALHNAIEMKKQEVMNVALSIVEQREFLESLSDSVKRLSAESDAKEKDRLISELDSSIRQRLSYDHDVDSQYFYAQAESLHEDFNAKLSENFPNLTQQEKRLATLLRLEFSSKYIATLMNITPKSVEISRYRLRQKLGLSKGDNLVNFIKSL